MPEDIQPAQLESVMQTAWNAYLEYSRFSLHQRAEFLRAIARQLDGAGEELVQTAASESNLPLARLNNEKGRTIFQLNSYADACERGDWIEARIDTALPDRNPPKPDIRKMNVSIGPVVVFGSSNFPFAFSTAGGDTACALAAGCPVIVKAHPAHVKTSVMVAELIQKAAIECKVPEGTFSHVIGAAFSVGEALVKHPYTKAVGFTGSFIGGKQLFEWGNERKEPIPVFAEMGSINPIFLLPTKLKNAAPELAKMFAGSVTLGVGQFCTNPGLVVAVDGPDLDQFVAATNVEIRSVIPAKMLHPGIAKSYAERSKKAITQPSVSVIAETEVEAGPDCGAATIATVSASDFLTNPLLQEEVFGPYSLIVRCKNVRQMEEVASQLHGQLTCTVMGEAFELKEFEVLVNTLQQKCGRIIFNSVPTGVEVCLSMQHGGPYPATTDSRFTSVGADGIKRFVRPLAFQGWPNGQLPAELRNENPLGIYRTLNNQLTQKAIN
jgi:2,5-dioxopentanoate dehydrogenase